jgi:hypothetical protein
MDEGTAPGAEPGQGTAPGAEPGQGTVPGAEPGQGTVPATVAVPPVGVPGEPGTPARDATSTEPPAPPPADAPPAAPPATRGGGRGRSVVMALLYLFTCLAMVASVLLVWSHQVALNTDRFVTVSTRIASDPVAIAGASDRLATQIGTAVDLETRLADALPDRAKPLAPLIASTIEDSLSNLIERGLSSQQFQQAWETANRVAHQNIVRLLRGETDKVTLVDGQVTLNLLPIVGSILTQIQTAGIIPASVNIPDLSDPEQAQASIDRLSNALGRPLPEDFGQIPLMKAEGLDTAQALVQAFDIVVVVAIVLTIALVVLTILLARHRLRMAIFLALGAAVAYAVSVWIVQALERTVVSAIATGDGSVIKAMFADFTADLTSWLTWIAIGSVGLAVLLYLLSRPSWLVRLLGGGSAPAEEATA